MRYSVKRAGMELRPVMGLIEVSNMLKRLSKVGLVVAVAGVLFTQMAAVAEAKELSDRSVKVLMNYAWSILPNKFTTQTGKVIEVDKKKRKAVMIPVPLARNIIQVARLSAHAQICNMSEEQAANYRAMMRAEHIKKKWSDLRVPWPV